MDKRKYLLASLMILNAVPMACADEWRTPEEVRDRQKTEWTSPSGSVPATTLPEAAPGTTSPTESTPATAPGASGVDGATSPAAAAASTTAGSDAPAPTPAVVEPLAETEKLPPKKRDVAKSPPIVNIDRRNKAIPIFNEGVTLYQAKKYDESLPKYLEAMKIDPTYASPHVNASMVYYFRRDWKNALAQLEEAIRVDKSYENPTILLNCGLFAGNLKLHDKAMNYFNLALEYNPADDDVYTDRGNLRLRMNQYQEALADYERALKINPKNEQALANKAVIMAGNWSGSFSNVLVDEKKGTKARPTPTAGGARETVGGARPRPGATAVLPKKPTAAVVPKKK